MNAQKVIDIARRNAIPGCNMHDSAALCLNDAEAVLARGDNDRAAKRALRSITYSVGVFHPAYDEAQAIISGVSV